MNDAFMEFFPDGTFKMESVEEGKFQSQGIFWFDETYMYVAELTETYCQGVGQYIVKLLDNGTLTFMRWDDSCNVRSGTMESFWEKQ